MLINKLIPLTIFFSSISFAELAQKIDYTKYIEENNSSEINFIIDSKATAIFLYNSPYYFSLRNISSNRAECSDIYCAYGENALYSCSISFNLKVNDSCNVTLSGIDQNNKKIVSKTLKFFKE